MLRTICALRCPDFAALPNWRCRQTPPEAAREALADSVEESDRVLTMLNTLMDVTEAENGMMRLRRARCSISELLEEVLEVYRVIAEERGIEVKTKLSEECYADIDPNRMRQAFANLIDNAVKYTEPGGTIEVDCHRVVEGVRVTIRDNGIGIPLGRTRPNLGTALSRR